jgi:hypothetical protein
MVGEDKTCHPGALPGGRDRAFSTDSGLLVARSRSVSFPEPPYGLGAVAGIDRLQAEHARQGCPSVVELRAGGHA